MKYLISILLLVACQYPTTVVQEIVEVPVEKDYMTITTVTGDIGHLIMRFDHPISNIIINNQDHRTKARFEENLIRFGPLQDTLYLHYLDRKTVTIYANYTKIINGQFIPLLDTMITSKDTLWILR